MARGKYLEKKAHKANLSYRKTNKALILKVPVPIEMTSSGLVMKPSTVDYTGVISGGKFIAFDAKETKITTRFPLANIHEHQIEYLEMVIDLGGIGFFLICFTELDKEQAYIVPPSEIRKWQESNRSSIPFSAFTNYKKVEIDDYLNDYIGC